MTDDQLRTHNSKLLLELHPGFAKRVSAVIAELQFHNLRPRIQEAWRSPSQQLAAYASGHSKLKFGFHNVCGLDGVPEALAVDLIDDDAPLYPPAYYLLHLADAAPRYACETGIRWGLPPRLRVAIDAAIATETWSRPVKVGWDPTHVQPADITIAQARAGKRPA